MAAFQQEQKDDSYRYYVTDALKVILESIVQLGHGKADIPRYADTLKPQKVETRTEQEVTDYIKSKLRALE